MDRMPEPGDPCPGFIAEAGRCWRIPEIVHVEAPGDGWARMSEIQIES